MWTQTTRPCITSKKGAALFSNSEPGMLNAPQNASLPPEAPFSAFSEALTGGHMFGCRDLALRRTGTLAVHNSAGSKAHVVYTLGNAPAVIAENRKETNGDGVSRFLPAARRLRFGELNRCREEEERLPFRRGSCRRKRKHGERGSLRRSGSTEGRSLQSCQRSRRLSDLPRAFRSATPSTLCFGVLLKRRRRILLNAREQNRTEELPRFLFTKSGFSEPELNCASQELLHQQCSQRLCSEYKE